jgi:hypothetical protein
MRHLVLLIALAAGGAAAWFWWTAPPAESEQALTSFPGVVPADVDGALLVADPARAARWAAGHPQALALFALAAPAVSHAAPEPRRILAELAGSAGDEIVAWWRGRDLAVSARIDAGTAASLERAAALTATPCRLIPQEKGEVVIELATSSALLHPSNPLPWPSPAPGRRSALCFTGGRWWRVDAGRSRLDLWRDAAPDLPPKTGPSIVSTASLATLGEALGAGEALPHGAARVVVGGADWAFALRETDFPPELRRLLTFGGNAPAESASGIRHWRGVLGDLWALPGPGVAVASSPATLAVLRADQPDGELGSLRGAEMARACLRLADVLEPLPLLGARAANLRRGVPMLAAVRNARWRILPAGGRISLEW